MLLIFIIGQHFGESVLRTTRTLSAERLANFIVKVWVAVANILIKRLSF